jgi:hypothetical protein
MLGVIAGQPLCDFGRYLPHIGTLASIMGSFGTLRVRTCRLVRWQNKGNILKKRYKPISEVLRKPLPISEVFENRYQFLRSFENRYRFLRFFENRYRFLRSFDFYYRFLRSFVPFVRSGM